MVEIILLLLGGLVLFGFIIILGVFLYGFHTSKHHQKKFGTKNITIIVPCKGADLHLEKNLRALCLQQYPKYNIIFVIDSKKDAAYPILERIKKDTNNTTIAFTEPVSTASGKIAALCTGVTNAKDAEILVFADSDIRPHKQWLSFLITPLVDPRVGATTGFRWFFPNSLKSYLLSAWNMGSIISLFHPLSNYTWGGSTAITKDLFDQLEILKHWKHGLSDDLILTRQVKHAGKEIRFLPRCVIESPLDTSIRSFLNWATQQFTWIRWYNPSIWVVSFISMLFLQCMIFFGFLAAFLGYLLVAILLLSLIICEMLYGLTAFLVLRSQMQYPKDRFGSALPYVLFMPLIFLFFTYNLLWSATKKEIHWQGKTYQKKHIQ